MKGRRQNGQTKGIINNYNQLSWISAKRAFWKIDLKKLTIVGYNVL